jgi:hypothetical protein
MPRAKRPPRKKAERVRNVLVFIVIPLYRMERDRLEPSLSTTSVVRGRVADFYGNPPDPENG